MKLINQSFEILEQKDFSLTGIKKFIERCGRVCYKSENKITDNSYEKFVGMLESKGHDRPLEFGTVHLELDSHSFNLFRGDLVINNDWHPQWIKYNEVNGNYYITTNYRYYNQIRKNMPNIECVFTEEDNEYYPKRYTVHFILSRGIMDEFRTHVGLSHLAESTRYCNYSKGKFSNEITFIKSASLDISEGQYVYWDGDWCDINKMEIQFPARQYQSIDALLYGYYNAEMQYKLLLDQGWKPQEARDVLPLGVKSELISCGFKDAWDNFFYRRCANDAHPMAREIACSLKDRMSNLI